MKRLTVSIIQAISLILLYPSAYYLFTWQASFPLSELSKYGIELSLVPDGMKSFYVIRGNIKYFRIGPPSEEPIILVALITFVLANVCLLIALSIYTDKITREVNEKNK